MKKLGKLSISPEKVMKKKELVNLKGGGYMDSFPCDRSWETEFYCYCNEVPSTWFGCYDDQAAAEADGANSICPSGGATMDTSAVCTLW